MIQTTLTLPPLPLEGGGVVDPHRARVWQAGPPDGPVVLLVHALTGDAQAGGEGGWWAPVIGPGRALDPTTHRLVCVNNLGSCYGSSAPTDAGFPRRTTQPPPGPAPQKGHFTDPAAALPAVITPWDQARAILQALDALGISSVELVTGGSLGACITLCLAALDPPRFKRMAPFAGCLAASPWIIALNHTARQTLLADPGWPDDPARGLALARQLAMISYRAEPGMAMRDDRQQVGDGWAPRDPYRVQTWLEHQGQKLVARFDAQAYLCQLDAMDHHDVQRPQPGMAGDPLGRVTASCLAVGIDTDMLYLPAHSARTAQALQARGVHAEHAEIHSPFGHDAFLIEWAQLDGLLRRALALPPGGSP